MAPKYDILAVTIPEACRRVSIGRSKLYEAAANGEIVIRKLGGRSLIRVEDLENWINGLPVREFKP